MDKGVEVIIVSSGAIGAGMWLLGLKKRPMKLEELQATASIGQGYLMHIYSDCFKRQFKAEGYNVGQILLTQEDFTDRRRCLNIKNTINALLRHKAIPIINENDTIATEEIKCGDNDRLSSLVADLCEADALIILSDVDGLLDEEGKVIPYVDEITPRITKLGGKSHCDLGTGGMATKIDAVKIAANAGVECIIVNGNSDRPRALYRIIVEGEGMGTIFAVGKKRHIAKKRWIAHFSSSKGEILIDEGAKKALCDRNKSLLASGILNIKGNFKAGDVIKIADKNGKEFARGLTGYSSEDMRRIKGLKSDQFKSILGYKGADEVIHKDNLVIL